MAPSNQILLLCQVFYIKNLTLFLEIVIPNRKTNSYLKC